MKLQLMALISLITISLPLSVHAQSELSTDANAAVRIAEVRRANAALIRQYTWTSRTEIIDQGQVKDTRIELVSYAPTGQLQRTLLNDQNAPLPRGFLRRYVAEDERKKMEEYLKGLQGLLEQYTLSTTGKILDFITSARLTGPDASGAYSMTGNNVVLPGDSLTIWPDLLTGQMRKIQVETTFQGNPVQLTATFATLPSGLNYVAYAEARVPAKQLSVMVQNYNYTKPN
ncbi:MAG TPA: hypothetical protein VEI28_01175 [Thermodesulfovibrionales bacterium]|nr:hypothetical protein [Thermodesulfovibrionales bacterium]